MNNLQITHFENYTEVIINRPQALNALNKDVFSELNELLNSELPPTSRLLVLTGAGEKAFVAGADITEFSDLDAKKAEHLSLLGQGIFAKLQRYSVPTMAFINGYALGGGLELALACNIRLVTKKAVLGLPELNLGLIPGYGGTQRMPHLIGKGKAMYYLLTSENMTGEQAVQNGLADFLVEDIAEGKGFIENFAKKMSAKSRVSSRLALEAIQNSDHPNGFESEARSFGEAFSSEDMKEGVSAFLEKRKPVFSHR